MNQLRLFVAVIDAGSISAGAGAAGLTQPTVSAHIRSLEADVGATLLDRSGRTVRPTAAGEAVLRRARKILALAAETLDEVGRISHRPLTGTLHIGVTTTLTARLLPPMLQSFLQENPGVRVELPVTNTSGVVQRVLDGTVCVGFIADAVEQPGLITRRIGSEPQIVIVSGTHPLAGTRVEPRLLRGSHILVREPGCSTRHHQEDLLARWQIPGAQTMEISSTSAIVDAVAAGLGLSCLPAAVAQDALAVGRVAEVHLDPPPPDRPLTLLQRRDRPLSYLEEQFLAHVEAQIP